MELTMRHLNMNEINMVSGANDDKTGEPAPWSITQFIAAHHNTIEWIGVSALVIAIGIYELYNMHESHRYIDEIMRVQGNLMD